MKDQGDFMDCCYLPAINSVRFAFKILILIYGLIFIGSPKVMAKNTSLSEKQKSEVVVLAGGCFWGVEELLRTYPGVLETRVGYSGGQVANPTYNIVKLGTSDHAESVEVTFDPKVLSFEKLLLYFFKLHDPTTKNQQGNDRGSQYRSVIFYRTAEQQKVAEEVKARVEKSGAWKKPIVTEIQPFKEFYPAEDYHQKYLQKNPDGYTCHFVRDLKF
jgi:methionine-S-sulfoxide reductase